MPAKTSATLTEAELRLMEVLWAKGASTVQQVVDALPADSSAGLQLGAHDHTHPGKEGLCRTR